MECPLCGAACHACLTEGPLLTRPKALHGSDRGDFLLKGLSTWGVKRVFGYPGDGINGIMGAFGRSDAIQQ